MPLDCGLDYHQQKGIDERDAIYWNGRKMKGVDDFDTKYRVFLLLFHVHMLILR